MPEPPSLRNIFKEIRTSFALPANTKFDCTLETWTKQGVFSLNTVLTVRENSAFSHRHKGWEIFTDRVIDVLLQKTTPIVFLCWGSAAIQKVRQRTDLLPRDKVTGSRLDDDHHLILTSTHPSPLSAYRGFFGCGHFIKTNHFLQQSGSRPIDWT